MNYLFVVAHPDDEVLGCGGIIPRYVKEGHEVYVGIVTKVCEPIFTEEEEPYNSS